MPADTIHPIADAKVGLEWFDMDIRTIHVIAIRDDLFDKLYEG
jgi:hypothetical protein